MRRVCIAARLGLLLLVAATLGGCGILQAVRDFSKQSAQLAAYEDVTNKVVSNPGALLHEAPQTADFSTIRVRLKASGDARVRRVTGDPGRDHRFLERRDGFCRIADRIAGTHSSNGATHA
jgi:hypothetical protein